MRSSNYPKFVKRFVRRLPDRIYIQLRYFSRFHRFCNLKSPSTYNEKLQWLKLNYLVPGESDWVDKFEAKNLVANKIGAEHLIPTLGVYDTVDEINFDELPEAFVLKCTHDSGGVVLVKDKRIIDSASIREELQRSMDRNYFYNGREPHYRDIRPRIIAEPFLGDKSRDELRDYKFFCFDGEVKALFIASDRTSGDTKFDYFDTEFSPLNIRQEYPQSPVLPAKPEHYETMLAIARKLSDRHPHMRVDLYEANGQVYFGELTFYHYSGFMPFIPPKWDQIFGDWLTLPGPVNG